MSQQNSTPYAVYHSVHDNFYWMSHFGDPSFTRHRATATVWITAALLLTTMPLPPIDVSHYSYLLSGKATEIDIEYRQMLLDHGVSIGNNVMTLAIAMYPQNMELLLFLDFMVRSALMLGVTFGGFQDSLTKLKQSTNISQQLSAVNIIIDKMMNVERAFIHPDGLSGRPYYKYVPSWLLALVRHV